MKNLNSLPKTRKKIKEEKQALAKNSFEEILKLTKEKINNSPVHIKDTRTEKYKKLKKEKEEKKPIIPILENDEVKTTKVNTNIFNYEPIPKIEKINLYVAYNIYTAYIINKNDKEITNFLNTIFGDKDYDYFIQSETRITKNKKTYKILMVEDKNNFKYTLWFDITNLIYSFPA